MFKRYIKDLSTRLLEELVRNKKDNYKEKIDEYKATRTLNC